MKHGILGPSDIPEDPLGDRHEPVTMCPGQDGECLPVAALGLLDEITIQPIILRGVHRGRLPTVLSRGGVLAFDLQVRRLDGLVPSCWIRSPAAVYSKA
ncbi:MAG TPA: hypothetical protein VIL81_04470 [Candidatus Limnocylindrales bacterium]